MNIEEFNNLPNGETSVILVREVSSKSWDKEHGVKYLIYRNHDDIIEKGQFVGLGYWGKTNYYHFGYVYDCAKKDISSLEYAVKEPECLCSVETWNGRYGDNAINEYLDNATPKQVEHIHHFNFCGMNRYIYPRAPYEFPQLESLRGKVFAFAGNCNNDSYIPFILENCGGEVHSWTKNIEEITDVIVPRNYESCEFMQKKAIKVINDGKVTVHYIDSMSELEEAYNSYKKWESEAVTWGKVTTFDEHIKKYHENEPKSVVDTPKVAPTPIEEKTTAIEVKENNSVEEDNINVRPSNLILSLIGIVIVAIITVLVIM